MIMIRGHSALGTAPGCQLTRLSGYAYPSGLMAFRAIRGALREVTVTAYPHPGRRPPP